MKTHVHVLSLHMDFAPSPTMTAGPEATNRPSTGSLHTGIVDLSATEGKHAWRQRNVRPRVSFTQCFFGRRTDGLCLSRDQETSRNKTVHVFTYRARSRRVDGLRFVMPRAEQRPPTFGLHPRFVCLRFDGRTSLETNRPREKYPVHVLSLRIVFVPSLQWSA